MSLRRLCVGLGVCLMACDSSASGKTKEHDAGDVVHLIDRSGLTNVSTSGRLDYTTPEYWVCRPDIEPNECARNIDATEVKPDGSLTVMKHVPAEDPSFDCFYVYPTVWISQPVPQMNDFSDEGVKLVLDPLLAQAARFTSLCRVFAPLYRQVGLSATSISEGADKSIALQDVRDAFKYYLDHFSKGRKFVLMGHSQGAVMLTSLIRLDIETDSGLRERMISALLLGAQPYAPPSERVGGSFEKIAACRDPGETGCVIAYNSFAAEKPPTNDALVGHVTTTFPNEDVDTTGIVFCTEPAMLAGNSSGHYRGSYSPLSVNNASFGMPKAIDGVTTPYVVYRDLFRGKCVQNGSLNYLEISEDLGANDKRMPEYRNTLLESVGFGMHLADYNIALDDLMDAVKMQVMAK